MPLVLNTLSGSELARITHQTDALSLLLAGNHREQIAFHVTLSSHAPLVLGLPWLQKHNPVIDWAAALRVLRASMLYHLKPLTYPLYPL